MGQDLFDLPKYTDKDRLLKRLHKMGLIENKRMGKGPSYPNAAIQAIEYIKANGKFDPSPAVREQTRQIVQSLQKEVGLWKKCALTNIACVAVLFVLLILKTV